MERTTRDRVRGMFLGIAIGDALFMPVEGFTAQTIASRYGRVKDYLRPDGHKWFDGRDAGTWTDDTQLTLVIAESLIASRGIDMDDLARRHIEALEIEGDRGFGPTSRDAIKRLIRGVHWSESGKTDDPKKGFGNGLPMKVSPIGAYRCSPFFSRDGNEDKFKWSEKLRQLSLMTHASLMSAEAALAHATAVGYCLTVNPQGFSLAHFCDLLARAGSVKGHVKRLENEKDDILERFELLRTMLSSFLATEKIIDVFGGGTSYVYNSLPFSYAFFLRDPRSIESLYDAGNAGGDTDTNASIVGGLLGALNGVNIFPEHLTGGLKEKERIFDIAERFCEAFGIGA